MGIDPHRCAVPPRKGQGQASAGPLEAEGRARPPQRRSGENSTDAGPSGRSPDQKPSGAGGWHGSVSMHRIARDADAVFRSDSP